MEYVHWGLGALALLWGLQCVGSVYQIRKYRRALAATMNAWQRGYLGVGCQRGVVSQGALVILVLTEDHEVATFQAMTGRTIFSRFKTYPQLCGYDKTDLLTALSSLPAAGKGLHQATVMAFDQACDAHPRKLEKAPRKPSADTGQAMQDQPLSLAGTAQAST
ncbi:transcriptional regulator GutM [Pokkaliibacter sp. MBI-7]|uniref:transcriptional regulator GutM n=1 Tax=Pokkaliibacter sp. MBI-7 TaxID=3040600 RepID=UPI00244B2823|nr:transcriptional regulator GutM [Pokkaliibacter sp. MBI-7]MDH2435516.1 transcriptional regulator GutM [Pokkaliibacter sp. MBI-7]